MKKYLKVLVPVLVLLVAAVIYTRPQTIEQRWDELDLTECTQISGRYYIYDANDGKDKEDILFTLTPDDPEFGAIIELMGGTGFRTRLRNLLPSGTRTHSYREGDFHWEVELHFDSDIELPSGDIVRGARVWIDNFYGDLTIDFLDDDNIRVRVADQKKWLAEVLELIAITEK